MYKLNLKSFTLINKKTNERIYLSNWNNETTNLNTGKFIKQSRRLFNIMVKSCGNDYFIKENRTLKRGEYININTGKIEKLFGID